MDYKEKYDQAFRKAKSIYIDATKEHCTHTDWLEAIFPELRESEDEKIRKNCIHFLELQKKHHAATFEIEECISWLEKQGEQKSAEYTLEQVASIFLDALSNTPYNNKPITDAQVITKELLKFLSDARSYNPNAINEQKPTWSEEDKAILLSVKCVVDGVWHNSGLSDYDEKELQEMWEWLDEIWRRVEYPQPKQEWSEEDEKMLNACTEFMGNTICPNYCEEDGVTKQSCRNWLKSIKDRFSQPHWKPSEYDISLLEEIARNIRNNTRPFCSEVSALEDLIKNIKTL